LCALLRFAFDHSGLHDGSRVFTGGNKAASVVRLHVEHEQTSFPACELSHCGHCLARSSGCFVNDIDADSYGHLAVSEKWL
jgi:hypothetical protein